MQFIHDEIVFESEIEWQLWERISIASRKAAIDPLVQKLCNVAMFSRSERDEFFFSRHIEPLRNYRRGQRQGQAVWIKSSHR